MACGGFVLFLLGLVWEIVWVYIGVWYISGVYHWGYDLMLDVLFLTMQDKHTLYVYVLSNMIR